MDNQIQLNNQIDQFSHSFLDNATSKDLLHIISNIVPSVVYVYILYIIIVCFYYFCINED